jgi:hypothetical protein
MIMVLAGGGGGSVNRQRCHTEVQIEEESSVRPKQLCLRQSHIAHV